MARKPIERRLPPLKELFPGFRSCPARGHRLHLSTDYLRKAARRLRKTRQQAFYSMREAARFLAVPLRTVELAYQQLENEGLIVRVRGSRTVLLGKGAESHHPARSIVSVPLQLGSLISSHFSRRFCQRISAELWRHHFVANIILFEQSADTSAAFARRLINQSDIVIWLFTSRGVKETILITRDHGVRNVLLNSIEDPFLPASYLMDWTSVYRETLLDWKAAGIRHVVVARPVNPHSQKAVDGFLHLLRGEDFTCTLAEPAASDLREKVERARKKKTRVGCAILEHETSYRLCNRDPVTMAWLTTKCRMLFGRGRIHAPHFMMHDYRADVIAFAGDKVAARVARDLGRRSEHDEPARLQPEWMPKVKLSEVFI